MTAELAERYRRLAREWSSRAEGATNDKDRSAALRLREAYQQLADLSEAQGRDPATTPRSGCARRPRDESRPGQQKQHPPASLPPDQRRQDAGGGGQLKRDPHAAA